MAILAQFPSNCGLSIIHALDDYDEGLEYQIKKLRKAFYNTRSKTHYDYGYPQIAAVILSDVVYSEAWKETKAVAKQIDLGVNPNSGNDLILFIVNEDALLKLEVKLEKLKWNEEKAEFEEKPSEIIKL